MGRAPKQTPQEKTMITELRSLYGGMMSLGDICTEIGRGRDAAKRWIQASGIDAIVINNRSTYRTTDVAMAIEGARRWA